MGSIRSIFQFSSGSLLKREKPVAYWEEVDQVRSFTSQLHICPNTRKEQNWTDYEIGIEPPPIRISGNR